MKKILYSALIMIGFGGCQTVIDETYPAESPVTFSAKIETFDGPTRTAMTDDRQVVWSEGDQIAIFYGDNVADMYQISDNCVDTPEGEFTKVRDNDPGERLDATVALYPYADNLSIEKVSADGSEVDEYEISGFVLPEKQTYSAESFGEGAFPMAAITDADNHSLDFRNLLGAIKLQLVGTELVKSVKIKGKNGERLSGAAAITVYSGGLPPLVRVSDENGTYATLDCGNGVQLDESKATTFIIALPPVTFSKGFIVQVYGADGEITQELEASTSNEIIRSSVLVMPVKKGEPADYGQPTYEGIKYTSQFGTEDKRLYTIEQKVDGELVTYNKYNEEIAREPFTKDINLEVLFSIPEIVYVESESLLSDVKLKASTRDGDVVRTREDDGFTISNCSKKHNFRFNAEEKVTVNTEYEKLKYGSEELPYTEIETVSFKSYESSLNEVETNDDAVVHDVTLYFEVGLKERNLETAQSQKHTVAVTYKRVYERKEYTVVENENISYTSQFGTEDKRLYTIEQKVDGELVTYNKYNEEIAREPFTKDMNLEALFSIPEIVYVESESLLSDVKLKASTGDGDVVRTREDDGFTISNCSKKHNFRFNAEEKVTVNTEYEKLKYGSEELPYTEIETVSFKSYESSLNEVETNDDAVVHDVTLYFKVGLKERNLETAQSQKHTVAVTYKRVYERKEYTVVENENISYTSQFGTEDKRLYTIEQKVDGELVTYNKDNEEIAREPFTKDINLEVLFSIPEIVYVESESLLSAVKLKASTGDGDVVRTREDDGFTISNCSKKHNFRFNAEEKVTVNTEYEKLKYGSEELPYTEIETVSFKSYESSLNEVETNDDAVVHDLTLYFEVGLKERNLETAQSQKHTVAVTYKRAYERKEHTEVE